MKRFLIGLALCFMPVFSFALPVCEEGKISFTCSEDGDNKQCQFYQYYAGAARDCELPDKYKDENGRACFKNGDLYPCDKTPKKPDDLGDKEPKQPDPNPPQGDKQPKNEIAPKGMCYYFGGTYAKSKQGVCSKYGGGWTWGANGCTTSAHKEGFGIMPSLVQCPKGFEQDEQPKTPKNPPGDGKQPNDGNNGKGGKGEGNGSGEGTGDGNGKGSKGDGSGKGSKGEGNGKGEGSGDAEGKGMFKGGAGSGQLGDVRVPKSRDGMGWKGDFFLRNPNQCPQDKSMHVLGRSITFSYSKLCSFLDMLAPVIKAVFMFIAGMLVVKSIRAK